MRIALFLSTAGGSPLQVGLERGLSQLGHQVEYSRGDNADLVIVFNQCAHQTSYEYPDFPTHGRIAFVDTAEYGYFKRLPAVAHAYQNTFSPGAMAHDTKNPQQQARLKNYLEGKSFPYFMREYLKCLPWPESYHPIDYPLYAGSECWERPNREEYLSRTLDLYVRWGASHPWRRDITKELEQLECRSDISIIGEPIPRIPQDEYFRKMKSARCSVSFDGYGSSSFRLTEALCRTVLVRGPLAIHCRDDLTDGVNCIEFGIDHKGEDFRRSDAAQAVAEVLANPEKSFEIYAAGYEHCFEHYTERATAAYVLRVIEGHDWGKATQLDL